MHLFFATFFRSVHLTWRHEKLKLKSKKRLLHYMFAIEFTDYLYEIEIDHPILILRHTLDLWSPWWSSSFLPQTQHHHDLYQLNAKFLRGFHDLIRFYETFQVELVHQCKLNTQWPPTTRRYQFFLLLNHLVAHYGSLKIEKTLHVNPKWMVYYINRVSI